MPVPEQLMSLSMSFVEESSLAYNRLPIMGDWTGFPPSVSIEKRKDV
jgi:hypothetical protein